MLIEPRRDAFRACKTYKTAISYAGVALFALHENSIGDTTCADILREVADYLDGIVEEITRLANKDREQDRNTLGEWTPVDSTAAAAEGWDLFDEGGTYGIEKDDDSNKFATDSGALAYVMGRAKEESRLHAKALALVDKPCPPDAKHQPLEQPATPRAALLDLIMNAPDPCGYDKKLPGYQGSWDKARALLRATCPAHKVEGGTCDNCHGDTEGDEA